MADSKDLLELQDDFNRGLQIDKSSYTETLNYLSAMGFSGTSTLEAVIVTNNQGAESAIQYLLSDINSRKQLRMQAIADQGMSLLDLQQGFDLCREVQTSRNRLRKVFLERARTEDLLEGSESKQRVMKYQEFLKAITAGHTMNEKKLAAIQEYKTSELITEIEHEEALAGIGLSSIKLEEMKDMKPTGNTNEVRDCKNCWKFKRTHIALECMHVSLCEGCAKVHNGTKKSSKCPICAVGVQQYVRIFY